MLPYLEALDSEIRMQGEALPKGTKIKALHFGGGTPNYLGMDKLEAIITALRAHCHVDDSTHIALEMDPRLVTGEQAKALKALGISRISLGAQDFNEKVQKAINRVQPYEMVRDAVQMLRDAGLNAINIDLMYGLPFQTPDMVESTIEKALSLNPDRLAVFGYAHVPWMKKHQKLLEDYPLPNALGRYTLMMDMRARLLDAGYKAIGMDHYARENDALYAAYKSGKMRRNFMGYTEDSNTTLLGLGASSISSLPDGFLQNATDVKTYCAMAANGEIPIKRALPVSTEDKKRASIIEKLMCLERVSLPEFPNNPALTAQQKDRLQELEKDGLIKWQEGNTLALTETGLPFSRLAAACFDEYFPLPPLEDIEESAPRKHASAI